MNDERYRLRSGRKRKARGLLQCRFVLLMMVAISGFAVADEPFKVATPPLSTLSSPIQPDPRNGRVRFSGEAQLFAEFGFVYSKGDGQFVDNPYLILRPNASSLDLLPYLVERGTEERAEKIYVTNPREIAQVLLDSSTYAELLSGERDYVGGEAQFTISQFEAGYECDAASFNAHVLQVVP